MPSYKTHSILADQILPEINTNYEMDKESFKTFSIGPDLLIGSDYKLFDYHHRKRVRPYFYQLAKEIKRSPLREDPEALAFLYGQLQHYILDLTTHPLIYFNTENINSDYKIDFHGLVEMWIDDYMIKKYGIDNKDFYQKFKIQNKELLELIGSTYYLVYDTLTSALRYNAGINNLMLFDRVRQNPMLANFLKSQNIGDVAYSEDISRVLPYLNLEHDVWRNPISGERSTESFDDLVKKANERFLETVDDVNNYIYNDLPMNNPFIENDISYNTGFPCRKGQRFRYTRKK